MFELPVFPFDSSAITVTTTVWVGVCVAVFFNVRLGWTLTGLVVPGYLVPLLIARPITAWVVLVEGVLTYSIVAYLSERARLHPYWSSFFGRDRFFLIIVVSVLIRATMDGWILPWIGQWSVEYLGFNFDYRNDLRSFGLIVVALIANYFWKPGLRNGIIPMATCISVTYILVNLVLVPTTNFNIASFHLIYEDISTSLMASPKAYIIVITTAYIASWINLKYAWDFNGILIPALLGLLWHDPFKILASILECGVLLAIGTVLLQSSWLRSKSIQGGRKLLFFYTICFFMRLILSHLLPIHFPNLELSDTFGLGYLLSTLMAVKAHDKKLVLRLVKGTLQVSMVGAVVGSLVGYAFFVGPQIQLNSGKDVFGARASRANYMVTDQPIWELIRENKILLYNKRNSGSYFPPLPNELRTFRDALVDLRHIGSDDTEALTRIARRLSTIHYELLFVSDRYYYLREIPDSGGNVNGWGLYVIDTKNPAGICLQVPAPLDEWATVEGGMCLLKKLSCNGMAIAGTPRLIRIDGSADVTRNAKTMFGVFHQVYGQQPLQLRAMTRSLKRRIKLEDVNFSTSEINESKSILWVHQSLPPSLNLAELKLLVDDFEIRWNESPARNVMRKSSERFAELILNRIDRRRLVAATIVNESKTGSERFYLDRVHQNIYSWLAGIKKQILKQGTNSFQPASTEELLYLDEEVLKPLVRAVAAIQPTSRLNTSKSADGYSNGQPGTPRSSWLTEDVASHLCAIDATARVVGYRLLVIQDSVYGEDYLALVEGHEGRKGWGTYVFRPGLANDNGVEIPRPLFENRSFDFGVNLFQRLNASALLIAGAHPRANLDGSADISKASNRTSMFNLTRHVLLRQMGNRPFLISQVRAIQAPVGADVVVAADNGSNQRELLSPLKKSLVSVLESDQMTLKFVDGSYDLAGYELGILMQATAVQISQNKEIMSLWLSPSLRSRYREHLSNDSLAAQFESVGIQSVEVDLSTYLTDLGQHLNKHQERSVERLPKVLRNGLNEYLENLDVLRLVTLVDEFRSWQFTRVVDQSSGQAFLAVAKSDNDFPAVLNLTGAIGDQVYEVQQITAPVVSDFIHSRALWLEGPK